MAFYLVVLDAKHPLRDKLREIVTRFGGKQFSRLTDYRRLTTGLLDRLPSSLNILFLPRSVATLPIKKRLLSGYPRPAWIAIPSSSWLPEDITMMISSFLPPQDVSRFSQVSTEISRPITIQLQATKAAYRKEWEKLVTAYGIEKIGSFEEFLTTRQSPAERAEVYQEYATFLSQIIASPGEDEETAIPPIDEKLARRLGSLPVIRIVSIVYHILAPITPRADRLLESINEPINIDIFAEEYPEVEGLLDLILQGALATGNDAVALWINRYNPSTFPVTMVINGRSDLATQAMNSKILGHGQVRPIDDPEIISVLENVSFGKLVELLATGTPESKEKARQLGIWILETIHPNLQNIPPDIQNFAGWTPMLPAVTYLQQLQASLPK